jgi:hypothetical protein
MTDLTTAVDAVSSCDRELSEYGVVEKIGKAGEIAEEQYANLEEAADG